MARRPTGGSEGSDAQLDMVWSKLQPLFVAKRDQFFEAIGRHGLTPPHGHALTMLSEGPMRMRDIADRMVCDASYVTAVVDNLESLGLAVRQPSATDRRVKEIALTVKGKEAAGEIHHLMQSPPPALQQLSITDRRTLASILAKLHLEESESLWSKMPGRRPVPGN